MRRNPIATVYDRLARPGLTPAAEQDLWIIAWLVSPVLYAAGGPVAWTVASAVGMVAYTAAARIDQRRRRDGRTRR